MIHVTEVAHWSLVDDALGGFHDGVVRHLRLDTSDFVGPNLHAVIEGRQAVSVLVQFQGAKCLQRTCYSRMCERPPLTIGEMYHPWSSSLCREGRGKLAS